MVFLVLHGVLPEWSPDDPTVPWERWAGTAETLAASGAVVILVSSGARAGAVAACLRSGASAVIDVEDAKRGFDVVGDVANGTVRSSELIGLLPCPFLPDQLARLRELTTNETRVLFYLTCGYSAERVASILWSSVSTIRAHIRSIFRKLGVKSQIAAVAYANGTASTDLAGNESDGIEI